MLAAVLVLAVIAGLVPVAARLCQGGLAATRTKLSQRGAWSSADR